MEIEKGELTLLDSACRRIPGIRAENYDISHLRQEGKLSEMIQQLSDESILVIPVDMSSSRKLIMDWHAALLRSRPIAVLCSVCFVLVLDSPNVSHEWLDSFWIDTLDEFSELAVPSSFVVWNDPDSHLKVFRVVSAISSLVREIENLSELSRLDERIGEMEAMIEKLSRNFPAPS